MQRSFFLNRPLLLVLNLLVKPFYILGIDAGVQDARIGWVAFSFYECSAIGQLCDNGALNSPTGYPAPGGRSAWHLWVRWC